MIENDPSARMQVLSRGELMHPGACMVCGSGNCDDGYLSLGVYFDYEGQMYLCMTCAKQAGQVIGMLLREEVDVLLETGEKLTTENALLKARLDDYEPVINKLTDLFGAGLSLSSMADDSAEEQPDTELRSLSDFADGPGNGESEPEEPVKKPRRGNTNGNAGRNVIFT